MTTPLPPPPPPNPVVPPGLNGNFPDEPNTIDLNIPPEVLDKLAPPDASWFTQPIATVIAAGLAIVAAGVAWWNVSRQIHADDRRNSRLERVNAAGEALTAVHDYIDQTAKQRAANRRPVGQRDVAAVQQYIDAGNRIFISQSKLSVSGGFDDSVAALGTLLTELFRYVNNDPVANAESIVALKEAVTTAIKDDLARTPSEATSRWWNRS